MHKTQSRELTQAISQVISAILLSRLRFEPIPLPWAVVLTETEKPCRPLDLKWWMIARSNQLYDVPNRNVFCVVHLIHHYIEELLATRSRRTSCSRSFDYYQLFTEANTCSTICPTRSRWMILIQKIHSYLQKIMQLWW